MDCVYDRALREVGADKKYQKCFSLCYIILLIGLWGMAYTNIILALTLIPHTCKLPLKPNNVSEFEWKIKHIPRKADINGYLEFDSCLMYTNLNISNDTIECHEYTYDKKWYASTVPSEYDWICEKEINVANILAYSKVGEIIGSSFFGWFGDVYGRRLTYIISLIMLVTGRAISLIAGNSYLLFLVGCIIAYLPSWSVPQSVTVTAMEMSSARQRTWISVARFVSFSTGLGVMALLYWWLGHWKSFIIVTTVPLVPFVLLSWKMIESPRWLYTQGRVQECAKLLKNIAKANGRQFNINTEKELLQNDTLEKSQNLGLLALFSGKLLAINTIAQTIIWVAATLSYTILIMSSADEPDGNPFLDFAYQAVADLPSVFIAAWLADKYGRRYTAMVSFSAMAGVWAGVAMRESVSNAWAQYWWLLSLLRVIARLLTNIVFFVINLYNIEVYPTCLRQSGMSLGNIISGVTAAVCPYILYLGRRTDARLPSGILTVSSILGIISTTLLPETLNIKLPETLEEAKNFGRKNKSCKEPQLVPLTS